MKISKLNSNVKKTLAVISCSLILNFSANAGVIVDTNNDSFIDTSTGLEWMDFGINNGQSFNYVSSQLDQGGEYFGWMLPSLDQVFTMWSNVADLDGVSALSENLNHHGAGQFRAYDLNSNILNGDDSAWDATFDVIGYNNISINDLRIHTYGTAMFEGSDGLSLVNFLMCELYSIFEA